jgi:hypothetical protein
MMKWEGVILEKVVRGYDTTLNTHVLLLLLRTVTTLLHNMRQAGQWQQKCNGSY